mgnify:CR=1 FL=1
MMTANNGETTGHYPTTTVNGEPYDPSDNETLLELGSARIGMAWRAAGSPVDGSPRGIAVAINGAVIRRAQWAATPVRGVIDVVTAVQGG